MRENGGRASGSRWQWWAEFQTRESSNGELWHYEQNLVATEVKSSVKDLIANELSTMIKESLDKKLRKSLHNAQNGILSVMHSVVEQVMLNLLRKDVIEDTLEAHIPKVFDTYAAADRLSKRLLTSIKFMAPIVTVRRKKDTTIEQQKYSTAFATKDTIDSLEAHNDVDESPSGRSDSRSDETPRRKSSRRS